MEVGRVAILGAGTMGRAVAKGLIDSGHDPKQIVATAKSEETRRDFASDLGVLTLESNASAVADADIIVVCVKPKDTLRIVAEIVDSVREGVPIISIAAGVTLDALQSAGVGKTVIRAMPNTPCSIQRGLTVLSADDTVASAQLDRAKAVFSGMGQVFVLDESHMDTVTGLSASGPAFVFVFIEALADGAVARGLPRKVAIEMASQMVYGAASMVLASGKHPASLKDDVTTPAGCTIAGLLALEDGRIRSVVSRAIEVASQRAGELGKPKA